MVSRVCFFSASSIDQINREQYSLSDIRILKELGFDVIIANRFSQIPWDCDLYFSWWASGSVIPMIKAKIASKPNIVIAGGNEAVFYRDSVSGRPLGYLNMPFYKRLATRLTLILSTYVAVVSDFMKADVQQLSKRSDILVIPNCVDTEVFSPDSQSHQKYITTSFCMDQGPTELKRGVNFIYAAAKVLEDFPNEKFVVIGRKGDAYSGLVQLAQSLGILDSLRFTGAIDNRYVRDWLVQSKGYVQISDTETFGVAVAEAMSTCIPVVVSRRGALPDLVGDYGIYVDHNSVESISTGITLLLRMSLNKRASIGMAMRNSIIARYSYENRKYAIKSLLQNLNLREYL